MKEGIIYTAVYTEPNRNAVGGKVTMKFVGKGMKMEYDSFDDLYKETSAFKKSYKEKHNKDIEIKIFKHQVKKVITLF